MYFRRDLSLTVSWSFSFCQLFQRLSFQIPEKEVRDESINTSEIIKRDKGRQRFCSFKHKKNNGRFTGCVLLNKKRAVR
jgi:hypothetical protein